MTYQELKDEEQLYLMHTYGRFDVAHERIIHGIQHSAVWDIDGKKYIDLTSGIGVSSLGHDNELIMHMMIQK